MFGCTKSAGPWQAAGSSAWCAISCGTAQARSCRFGTRCAHTGRAAREQPSGASEARRSLHRLPPYAPEMNPVEGVYAYLKGHFPPGCRLPDLPALQGILRRPVRQVQCRPRRIRCFFHRTPLSF